MRSFKVNSIWLFIIFILPASRVTAERTSGFCYPREGVETKSFISLQPKVYFDSKPWNRTWTQIQLKVWVRKHQVYGDIRVKAKAVLYDESWKQVGKALLDFNPMRTLAENDTAYFVAISGYMENACIDPTSVPETELTQLLLGVSSNAKTDTFRSHLEKFRYVRAEEENNYTSYMITEPEFITQTDRPRILMIFYQDELIAIFHTRYLQAKVYDSIEMGSQYKMIYNSKFAEHTKKEMVKIYRKKVDG